MAANESNLEKIYVALFKRCRNFGFKDALQEAFVYIWGKKIQNGEPVNARYLHIIFFRKRMEIFRKQRRFIYFEDIDEQGEESDHQFFSPDEMNSNYKEFSIDLKERLQKVLTKSEFETIMEVLENGGDKPSWPKNDKRWQRWTRAKEKINQNPLIKSLFTSNFN